MFKHLLVPLDGSRLAEAALPAAAHLAEALKATVTLIHVIERHAPQAVHADRHLADPASARAYLTEVASRAFPPGVRVEQHVHTAEVRDVAQSIVEHAAELEAPDLIVMCTHGHALRQWVSGSIAQQVIGLGQTPVLLVRPPPEGAAPAFACRRILLPLDAVPLHESCIPVAQDLAAACGAPLHLLMVIPTLKTLPAERAAAGRLLPGAMRAALDLAQEEAATYLRKNLECLQAAGLTVTTDVRCGDPATVIAEAVDAVHADMVVLATHGKAGTEAFWSGSVAAKVISHVTVPVLLVHAAEAEV